MPCLVTGPGRWGQGPGQCRPKVPGRFAFPDGRNPRICSISQFGKIFPEIFAGTFPEFSSGTPEQTPETATAFSSFLKPPWLLMFFYCGLLMSVVRAQHVHYKNESKRNSGRIFFAFPLLEKVRNKTPRLSSFGQIAECKCPILFRIWVSNFASNVAPTFPKFNTIHTV